MAFHSLDTMYHLLLTSPFRLRDPVIIIPVKLSLTGNIGHAAARVGVGKKRLTPGPQQTNLHDASSSNLSPAQFFFSSFFDFFDASSDVPPQRQDVASTGTSSTCPPFISILPPVRRHPPTHRAKVSRCACVRAVQFLRLEYTQPWLGSYTAEARLLTQRNNRILIRSSRAPAIMTEVMEAVVAGCVWMDGWREGE